MNSDEVTEDYGNRRDILLEYLNDYSMLQREASEVTDNFSFEAYVQFAFSYYQTKENQYFAKRLEDTLSIMQHNLNR